MRATRLVGGVYKVLAAIISFALSVGETETSTDATRGMPPAAVIADCIRGLLCARWVMASMACSFALGLWDDS